MIKNIAMDSAAIKIPAYLLSLIVKCALPFLMPNFTGEIFRYNLEKRTRFIFI
jgi:hypothetical protein